MLSCCSPAYCKEGWSTSSTLVFFHPVVVEDERAEVLWRYGLPGAALRAARAGVYRAERPAAPDPPVRRAGRAGPEPLRAPCPGALIGAEARNLWLAAHIHQRAGNRAAAARYLAAAARAGCP